MKTFPKKRQKDLIVEELPDELLVYDMERDRALCLNLTAALVWKKCDGRTSVEVITRRLAKEITGDDLAQIDERLVWYAIKQLQRDHLLDEEVDVPARVLASVGGLNRRQVIRALGLTAIVALPLVTSVVVPTAVEAATCLPAGAACVSSAQCCSGLCSNNTCAGP